MERLASAAGRKLPFTWTIRDIGNLRRPPAGRAVPDVVQEAAPAGNPPAMTGACFRRKPYLVASATGTNAGAGLNGRVTILGNLPFTGENGQSAVREGAGDSVTERRQTGWPAAGGRALLAFAAAAIATLTGIRGTQDAVFNLVNRKIVF